MDSGGASGWDGSAGERCAECAWPRAERSLPRPRSLLHWRRTLPLLVMLLGAVALGIVSQRGVVPVTSGTGSFGAQLADPPITWGEVRQVAEGGGGPAGRELLDGVLGVAESRWWTGPFPLELHVAFTGPVATQSTHLTQRGWPVPWLQRSSTRRLDAEGGFRPIVTAPDRPPTDGFGISMDEAGTVAPRPRWEWLQSRILHAPPPEDTGGALVRTIIRPAAIALPVAVAWTLVLLVLAILAVIERVRRRELPARGRRLVVRGTILILALCVLVGLVVGSSDRRRSVDRFAAGGGWPGRVTDTPAQLDLGELADLAERDESAAARRLASAIVDAMQDASRPGGEPGDDHQLNHRIDMRGRSRTVGSRIETPLPLARWGATTWTDGNGPNAPVLAAPAGTHVQLRQGFLVVERSDGDPATPSSNVTLLLVEAGLVLAALLAAGGTAAVLISVLARRQAARRRREHRCVACGHAYSPGPAAS